MNSAAMPSFKKNSNPKKRYKLKVLPGACWNIDSIDAECMSILALLSLNKVPIHILPCSPKGRKTSVSPEFEADESYCSGIDEIIEFLK